MCALWISGRSGRDNIADAKRPKARRRNRTLANTLNYAIDRYPQKTWDAYYDRIKRRRLAEAALLWDEIEAAGANEETIFALDFAHFGNNRDDVDDLARQLSESYATEVSARSEQNYWDVRATTRPEGICFTKYQHAAWVEFMVDVAQSYACVFSEWTLEAPSLERTFQSRQLVDD